MPFRDILDAKQLAMLTSVLDDFCLAAGIEQDTPDRDEAAYLVMQFYRSGYETADELRTALSRSIKHPRYG